MNKILITGGSGFIGRALVQHLYSTGKYIRIFDNNSRSSQVADKYPKGVELVTGDIRDEKKVLMACRNIDTIIHLAFINGTRNFYEYPDLVLDVGVKGIISVLNSGNKAKVTNFFLASSSEVYHQPGLIPTPENVPLVIPDPYNPRYSYSGAKIISELLTIHQGMRIFDKTIIFRPHNVYGPNMGTEHVIPELLLKIISQLDRKKTISLPIQGTGAETRSFIFIDDFTNAFVKILRHGKNGQTYNVGVDQEISINRLVEIISKVVGRKIKTKLVKKISGGANRRCPDITKLKKLDFTPHTSLEAGLRQTFLWYNQNYLNLRKNG